MQQQLQHQTAFNWPGAAEKLRHCLPHPNLQQTVDLCENYRHAVWYMVFVAVYMIVLYFQASGLCC